MATTSSIGTSSRNYSTISAWLAAFATGGWIGECYNDSEFAETPSFSGHATSATDYIILRCATGQSFRDNANAQTNALKYNQSNGVGVKSNVAYSSTFTVSESYVTVQGLQLQQAGASGFYVLNVTSNTLAGVAFQNCIFENSTTQTQGGSGASARIRAGLITNYLIVLRSNAAVVGINADYGGPTLVNGAIVRPSDFTVGSTGVAFGAAVVKNCGIFGFSTSLSAAVNSSSDYNCSDQTLPYGAHNQASVTYANQFQNTTDASRDFRAKAGANLLDNGVTDTTDIPAADDIVGTSRPQGSAWDIGPWELIVAAAATPWVMQPQNDAFLSRKLSMIRGGTW